MSKKTTKTILQFTLIFLLIFISFGYTIKPNNEDTLLLEYNGPIEHLSFNTLIHFPEKALQQNNENSTLIDETKITPYEFKKILQQLYSNNYILIKMKDLFKIENNTIITTPLLIPKNKKPLILSFENVTYKSTFKTNGEIDKIIIDNDGKFATYSTKQNIQNRIAYDNEFLPILEEFIHNNPDFSISNAKGIIFLTVNNGILGYHINPKNNSSRHDQKRITELIRRLTVCGWEFGSNNYEYTLDSSLSEMQFTKNINLWNKYLTPIIDSSIYYSSPYGKNIDHNQLEILKNNNFKVFFYNDFSNKLEIKNNSIFMTKKFVSGHTLRHNQDDFKELFDCKTVYDHNQRNTVYPSS